MWAGTPYRVHIKINPPCNFTNDFFCLSSYPHCSHFRFIPISAACGCLTPAPHSPTPHWAAHHPPAATIIVLIAADAAVAIAVAIDVAIDVAATAIVSSAAACS